MIRKVNEENNRTKMKSKSVKCVLSLIFILCLSSCYSYKPAYIHSPKFENKGILNAELNAGNRFGVNLSYNPINYFVVLGEIGGGPWTELEKEDDTYYVNQNKKTVSSIRYREHYYGFGVGTYWNYSENIYQDFYIGYGEGISSTPTNVALILFPKDNYDLLAYESAYKNVYWQTSLKFTTESEFNFSLHGRVNYLKYNSFNYVFGEDYYKKATEFSKRKVKNYFWHREKMAVQIGISLEKPMEFFTLNMQLQFGVSRNDYPDHFSVRPVSMFIRSFCSHQSVLEEELTFYFC